MFDPSGIRLKHFAAHGGYAFVTGDEVILMEGFGRYFSTKAQAKKAARGHGLELHKDDSVSRTSWGEPYGPGPHFVLPDGRLVTMHRKGQKVRFFDEAGQQVGPEQPNVAPAHAAAYRAGWRSASPKMRAIEALAEIQEPELMGMTRRRK